METDPAIAVVVDRPACVVRRLGTAAPIDAKLSDILVEHSVRVRPGDMVGVNFGTDPPRVVYLWWKATVVAVQEAGVTIATFSGQRRSASVVGGHGIEPAVGDTVFLDVDGDGRRVVVDVAADGEPVHPERFGDGYARIRDRIRSTGSAEVDIDSPQAEGSFAEQLPEPLARVAALMCTFGSTWALCGGWAVDAWLGHQTRRHVDVDFTVFQDDAHALFDHLAGWQLIAHDAKVGGLTSEPWTGRPLDLPAHIHAREGRHETGDRLDDPAGQGFDIDVQVTERADGDWVFSRDPRVTMPLDACVRQSARGLPTLVPEVLLFHKATYPRPHDELDFVALLPGLGDPQRNWLRNAIRAIHPDHHPWLARLCP